VVPELLQLTLNVFLLQSIVCDSGEPLLVYIAAFRIAVADFETVFCLARKCVESSVRGNELHRTMLYPAFVGDEGYQGSQSESQVHVSKRPPSSP
jgi:hypothetical protein